MKPAPNHDDGIKVVAKKSLVEPVQDMVTLLRNIEKIFMLNQKYNLTNFAIL